MAPDATVAVEDPQSVTAEELAAKIDEAIAGTHVSDDDERAGSGDVDPESLEGQLRLALPGHTYFRTGSAFPAAVKDLLAKFGATEEQLAESGGPVAIQALYTEPTGYWMIHIASCHKGSHGYQVSVDGPSTEIARQVESVSDVLSLLRVLGAIK